MKNKDKWKPSRFEESGTHMYRIITKAYKPVISKYSCGILGDIGCGDVPYYDWYRDKVTDIICVDWGSSSLDLSYLDHIHDLNEPMTFIKDEAFDTVLCTDVLEHIHLPELLFSEMSRSLKPGGMLILTVPFMYWIHGIPHDYHRYTNFKLKDFCNKNSMEVIELNAYGGLPEIIYDLIHKGYSYYNLPGKKLFYFLYERFGKLLSRFGFVKRMSENSRKTFPLGYILVARKKKD